MTWQHKSRTVRAVKERRDLATGEPSYHRHMLLLKVVRLGHGPVDVGQEHKESGVTNESPRAHLGFRRIPGIPSYEPQCSQQLGLT